LGASPVAGPAAALGSPTHQYWLRNSPVRPTAPAPTRARRSSSSSSSRLSTWGRNLARRASQALDEAGEVVDDMFRPSSIPRPPARRGPGRPRSRR
jgi:hypothetical protein